MAKTATSPARTTLEIDLEARAGSTAAREFASAGDTYRPGLLTWLETTAALDDDAFVQEASSAIYGSSLVMSFRGNWEHEHFKASAAYHLAEQRHVAAGHKPECRGDNLYNRAWNRTAREAGHAHLVSPRTACTCTAV